MAYGVASCLPFVAFCAVTLSARVVMIPFPDTILLSKKGLPVYQVSKRLFSYFVTRK